ncbi:MAG: DUF3530 family protein [Marinagarivorans sp.]|nr:DUF3530 family protein [Marinagarivorans sp.]
MITSKLLFRIAALTGTFLALLIAHNSDAQTPPVTTNTDAPKDAKAIADKTQNDTQKNAAVTEPKNKDAPKDSAKTSEDNPENIDKPVAVPLGAGQSYYQTPAREQKLLQDFTQGPLGSGEAIELNTENETFIALWRSDTSGNPKGAALILPDEQISMLENNSIRNIQTYLSQRGWSTLTIALPKTYKAPPPAVAPIVEVKKIVPPESTKEEAAEAPSKKEADIVFDEDKKAVDADTQQAEDTKTAESKDANASEQQAIAPPEPPPPVEPIAQARLKSALDFLQQKGQKNIVVIAEGAGGARILWYLKEAMAGAEAEPKAPINGLIMLDANLAIAELAGWNAYDVITKLTIPTLDITHAPYSQSPEAAAIITTQKRRNAAQVGHVPIYQQRTLAPATLASSEMRITRVIRGFLKKYLESEP